MASLTALVAARESRGGGGVVYMSDQAHGSILRDLKVMGEGEVRVLRSDAAFRLPVSAVASAIAADRAAGLTPFAVVGTAGTTNTGAIDPLGELAALCEAEGLWFHVDGAYGAAAALTESGRDLLAGMELRGLARHRPAQVALPALRGGRGARARAGAAWSGRSP